ncbi:MAG: hypothetical protein DRR16_08745 [Candidatus Parabeggiatoa sp. nov. 3]|nr:MAG: hypothetical protein DRR00_11705 [Gammaproteobacteria bacterium]RKZ66970.1 MAG: hypothetical protein DRQ99_08050 [Gammaproteobacteria bacterium]RKZ86815.1 MAG: hypothetical protein DRR16_08745 [Gammaproteobacteria bacterium]HEW97815.1 hypothetical protein [Beggiatoa sp.]
MWMKQTIGEQRQRMTGLFEPALLNLSKVCVVVWSDLERLDKVLSTHFASIPHCHLVYAVDKFGKQISSNISTNDIDNSYRNQDLSRRPYCVSLYPKRHFTLSSVYISHTTGRPCISAVQPVMAGQQFLGFVVADFDIRHLPLSLDSKTSYYGQPHHDNPAQKRPRRLTNLFDKYQDDIQGILNKLISEHGVFHVMIHYASTQVLLWQIDNPYEYRIYEIEQLLDPDMYLVYPRCSYPEKAKVSTRTIQQVLKRFRTLRLADDSIYLRSGSLNIMNAMISLTFSCEGTEYWPTDEFLSQNICDWFETRPVNGNEHPHFINVSHPANISNFQFQSCHF